LPQKKVRGSREVPATRGDLRDKGGGLGLGYEGEGALLGPKATNVKRRGVWSHDS